MFASAAREAVFTRPDVIRQVKAGFIPVSALAPVLNGRQGFNDEAKLLRAIGRTAPAPQGLCVLNSDGQPLIWSLMFDDEKTILEFLELGKKLFKDHPTGEQPVATQRYHRFPSAKLTDRTTTAHISTLPDHHQVREHCPGGKPLHPSGTLLAQVLGRALDQQGRPLKETFRQEHYVEDEFYISPELQRELVKSVQQTNGGRVPLPDEFARLCTTHAYLGFLDVQPLNNPRRSKTDLKKCRFWAIKAEESDDGLFRVEGESEVDNQLERLGPGNRHYVKLAWNGYLEIKNNRLKRLLLEASGEETLRYGLQRHPSIAAGGPKNEVAFLPAGHPIDLKGPVRYGIIIRPLPENQIRSFQKRTLPPFSGINR